MCTSFCESVEWTLDVCMCVRETPVNYLVPERITRPVAPLLYALQYVPGIGTLPSSLVFSRKPHSLQKRRLLPAMPPDSQISGRRLAGRLI